MKRILASILVMLAIFSISAPLTLAANEEGVRESSSFDVFDILSPEADDETSESDVIAEAGNSSTSPAGVVILRAINILSLLIGTFAFVMIIIGGFIFATAGGEESKVDRGKAILTQSILGLIIAFSSYMIVTFIQSFFY